MTYRSRSIFKLFRQTPASAAVLATGFVLLATGCSSNFSSTASNGADATGVLSGVVHGGRQPVIGSTVTLWAAGNAGYGSAATSLGTTTTDASGSFTFHPTAGATYSCPTLASATASQSLYITATGGQPTTGVTNTSAAFMAALGDCSTVLAANPTLNVNEVTTVASMFALQQFFTPSTSGLGNIGSSATNALGLANAMETVKNLVNLQTGTAYATLNKTGAVVGYTTNPVITVTPEQTKINTLADVLAACVNTNGASSTPCSTLYTDVNATAAKDTIQAAFYLATNPTSTVGGTSNITAIYNIATAQSPFAPSLTAAPTDWTVGVTYGTNASQTVTGATVPSYLLTEPEYVGVDSVGNLWFANFGNTSNTTGGNSVSEFSPLGVPLLQTLTAPSQIAGPRNLIIDPTNNIYVGSYGTTANSNGKLIAEYTSTGATKTFNVGAGPVAIASDGNGDLYVATSSSITNPSADLEYIGAGAASGSTSSVLATGVSAGTFSSLAIDSYNHLWLSNNASTATTQYICTTTGTITCSGTASSAGGQTGSQSVSIDHSNNIWIGNYAAGTTPAGTVSELSSTTSTTIVGVAGSPFTGGGVASPIRSIFDGLGNYWVTNTATNAGSVSEFTGGGIAISPSVGYAHTYATAYGIAIDPSGNVWIGNGGSNAAASATKNGFFTEIVGAAAPAVTPFAANLPTTAGGTNLFGTRP